MKMGSVLTNVITVLIALWLAIHFYMRYLEAKQKPIPSKVLGISTEYFKGGELNPNELF